MLFPLMMEKLDKVRATSSSGVHLLTFCCHWKLIGSEEELIKVASLWVMQEVTGNVSTMLEAREKGKGMMHIIVASQILHHHKSYIITILTSSQPSCHHNLICHLTHHDSHSITTIPVIAVQNRIIILLWP